MNNSVCIDVHAVRPDPSWPGHLIAVTGGGLNLPPYLQEPVHMSGHWCLCTDLFRQGKLTPTNVDMLGCSRLREALEAHTPEATLGLRYHAI